MLKISVTDTRTQRRLILEGSLVDPWVGELRTTYVKVKEELNADIQSFIDLSTAEKMNNGTT